VFRAHLLGWRVDLAMRRGRIEQILVEVALLFQTFETATHILDPVGSNVTVPTPAPGRLHWQLARRRPSAHTLPMVAMRVLTTPPAVMIAIVATKATNTFNVELLSETRLVLVYGYKILNVPPSAEENGDARSMSSQTSSC
jgi:hypothetical protein